MGYRYEYVGGNTLATATGIRFFGVRFRKEQDGHVWPIAGRNVKSLMVAIVIPKGLVWSGRGMPFRYAPSEVCVIQLDGLRMTAEILLSVPLARKRRALIAQEPTA